jgi:hypothetical protein
MILPTKKLKPENSLIYLGGDLLALLDESKTVSRLWEEFQRKRIQDLKLVSCDIQFDWFILALDLLYLMGAIQFNAGRLEVTV